MREDLRPLGSNPGIEIARELRASEGLELGARVSEPFERGRRQIEKGRRVPLARFRDREELSRIDARAGREKERRLLEPLRSPVASEVVPEVPAGRVQKEHVSDRGLTRAKVRADSCDDVHVLLVERSIVPFVVAASGPFAAAPLVVSERIALRARLGAVVKRERLRSGIAENGDGPLIPLAIPDVDRSARRKRRRSGKDLVLPPDEDQTDCFVLEERPEKRPSPISENLRVARSSFPVAGAGLATDRKEELGVVQGSASMNQPHSPLEEVTIRFELGTPVGGNPPEVEPAQNRGRLLGNGSERGVELWIHEEGAKEEEPPVAFVEALAQELPSL